jgi:hypothetical protein
MAEERVGGGPTMNARPAKLAERCLVLAGCAAFAFQNMDSRYADA